MSPPPPVNEERPRTEKHPASLKTTIQTRVNTESGEIPTIQWNQWKISLLKSTLVNQQLLNVFVTKYKTSLNPPMSD